MKAERRHELKHNELADWLGERLELLRPHATGIVLGIVLLGVIVVGSVWYFGGENHAASAAWSRYFESFNDREPQKALETLASDQSGSKAGWWALLTVADMHLGQGTALLHSDRSEAKTRLEQAKTYYQRVESGPADPILLNRARLGLAKTYESLCQPEEALKYYELVATNEKSSAIGKVAAEAAERLKDQREVEFLAWFAKQEPKRPAPMPGIGGSIPGLPGTLSDRPDISLGPGLGLEGVTSSADQPAPATTTDSPPQEGAKSDDGAEPGDNAQGEKSSESKATEAKTAPDETKPGDQTDAQPAAKADEPRSSPPGESDPAAEKKSDE